MLAVKTLLSPKRHPPPSYDDDLESNWENIDFYPEDHVYYNAYNDASRTLNHPNETLNIRQASRWGYSASRESTPRKRTKMSHVPCISPSHKRLSSTFVDDDDDHDSYESTSSLKSLLAQQQVTPSLDEKMDSLKPGFILPPPRRSSICHQMGAQKTLPEGLLVSIAITDTGIFNNQVIFRVLYTYCPLWNESPPFRVSTYRTFYELYDYHLRLYRDQKGEVDEEARRQMLDFPRPIDGLDGWEKTDYRFKSLNLYFTNLLRVPVTRGTSYLLDHLVTRHFLAVRPGDRVEIVGKAQMGLDWESTLERKEMAKKGLENESRVDAVLREDFTITPAPQHASLAVKPSTPAKHHSVQPTLAFPIPFAPLSPRSSAPASPQSPMLEDIQGQDSAPHTPTHRSIDYSVTSLSPQTPTTPTAAQSVIIIETAIHNPSHDKELPPVSYTTQDDRCVDDGLGFAHILLVERNTWKTWQVLVDVDLPWETIFGRLYEVISAPLGSRLLKGLVHRGSKSGEIRAREILLSNGKVFVEWVKEAQKFLLLTIWVEESR
ncbi:hypothetical protein I350_08161 [Cryptococcus amylolentus CBS 6273]|uniref:PX domain-containing protein n=1 Tax=Cryptococcus amylolentus CBS 6273 TaxID=1296118 RepID=A0A1E3JB86_9TREE|nr:hypothetical protein I350_08161 [Cryptococcus amylolentus CBS 6273]